MYVSNVLAASADWRTGAAAASWALTLAAWISADFVSGGIPVPPTGATVATGPDRGERGRRRERHRVGGLGGGERGRDPGVDLGVARQVVREGAHAGGDAADRQPDRQPQGDEPRGLRELDAGDEVGLAARALLGAHRERPLAVGAGEDGLLDLADRERFGDHGRPRFLRCDLRCPARSTTGDVDGHGSFPERAAAQGTLQGATAARVSAFRGRSAVGRWSGWGSTFAADPLLR